MAILNLGALAADAPPGEPLILEGPEPEPAPKEHTIMVAMCNKCRAWYNSDMEEGLDDDHFNFRTGEPCHNEDDWFIMVVPDREDWYNVR